MQKYLPRIFTNQRDQIKLISVIVKSVYKIGAARLNMRRHISAMFYFRICLTQQQFLLRFCRLLRYFSFLLRRHVTHDDLAFRRHFDLQINRDFAVQSDWNSVFTNALQRLAQVNAMTIDLVTALFQCFREIHRRDRAIQVRPALRLSA